MNNQILITTDKSLLDINLIHQVLKDAYWSKNRTKATIKKSIENSRCSSLFFNKEQVGFARVVTDTCIFAYIMDVFILENHQSKGYGKRLVYEILNDLELKDVEQWYLKTKDAHTFYKSIGFKLKDEKQYWMKKK